jgi:hypothetical protein
MKSHVLDAYDPRITTIDPPEEVLKQGLNVTNEREWIVTDWAVGNLTDIAAGG